MACSAGLKPLPGGVGGTGVVGFGGGVVVVFFPPWFFSARA